MRPHYSQSSRENATPSSGTSPLASYKEVPPPPPNPGRFLFAHVLLFNQEMFQLNPHSGSYLIGSGKFSDS